MGIINKEKEGKVILGYKDHRRMGIRLAHVQGQSVESVGSIMIHVLHARALLPKSS
jgi:hypothetical protein